MLLEFDIETPLDFNWVRFESFNQSGPEGTLEGTPEGTKGPWCRTRDSFRTAIPKGSLTKWI